MAALLVLPFFLTSQNKVYTEDFNLDLKVKEANTFMGKTCASLSQSKIYFMKGSDSPKNRRILHVFDLTTHKTQDIEIVTSKETKILSRYRIDAFEVIDDKIIILTDPEIIVLKISKGKAEFLQKTNNTKFFNYVSKASDNKAFLYINYNFHPMDAPDKHVWAHYDIAKNEIVNIRKMPDDNAVFTHFINGWVSVCKDKIAFSKSFEYSIYFYNSAFEKTDSIKSDLLLSNKKYSDLLTKSFGFTKDNIVSVQQLDDSVLTRIQKIFYIDSAHLFVTLKLPKVKQLGVHLWEKKGRDWSLIKSDSIPYFYETGKAYTDKNNSMTGFYGNADALICDGNGAIYYVYSPYIDKVITKSFDLQADYTNKINELIKANNMTYGLKKFTFEKK